MITNKAKRDFASRKKILKSLILMCLLVLLVGCSIAENTIISEFESPDAKYNAIVFSRSAGATTRDSYQLTVLKTGEQLKNLSGNVFISYSSFDIEWQDDNNLIVYIDESLNNSRDSEVFKQEKTIYNIKVHYLAKN